MAKFFIAATNIAGGRAFIRGRDAEHIKVLRMRPGEEVVLSDGEGTDYVGQIVRVSDQESEIEILVDLKSGDAASTAWGCDLTYDYVKINGDYRT